MKQPFGTQLLEHQAKNLTMDDDVIEYRRQMESEIMANVHKAVAQAKDQPLYKNHDFYIVLLIRKERFGDTPNTLALARRSCPTPVYKQSVWKYHSLTGSLEFLWCIPDAVLYHHIKRNPQQYLDDKETKQLAQYVILMESGELLDWVKKENGEKKDAVIKLHKEGELDGRKLTTN